MKTFKNFRESVEADEKEAYSEETCSECGCDPKNPKKDCDCDHNTMSEAPMDGVAKGSLPDDQHMCATKIFKEGFGEGTPILGEHSLPDADGNVAWYKVMFEHGVEIVTVGEEGVAVLEESNHGNHKKKMKEEVEEIEEVSKKTLGSYIKKATGEVRGASLANKDFQRDAKAARSDKKKSINNQIAMNFSKRAEKRKSGIETAADKLVNKKTDD